MTTKPQAAADSAAPSRDGAAAVGPKASHRGKRLISTARIESAEFKRNVWRAHPEEGTPYETVLGEAYWAHQARQFRPGDRIEVLPDEMHYFAELLVIAAGATWARVVELSRRELGVAAVPDKRMDYTVAWRGVHRKFAVVRTVDGAIIKDGFSQQQDAELALLQHAPR